MESIPYEIYVDVDLSSLESAISDLSSTISDQLSFVIQNQTSIIESFQSYQEKFDFLYHVVWILAFGLIAVGFFSLLYRFLKNMI